MLLNKVQEMTGSEILVESLIQQKVEAVFGSIGDTLITVFEHLHNCNELKLIGVKHEQATVHAADGYARATGKPGVTILPAGSGVTNAITGIATAQMDSVPLVVIVGQISSSKMGSDYFREIDANGITLPITKFSFQVLDINDLSNTINEAFYLANTGRPGPVLIEIPNDILLSKTTFSKKSKEHVEVTKIDKIEIKDSIINQIKDEIEKAKKPVLFIGGGVIASGASDLLIQLATKANIPVVTTMMGIGAFPSNHPLFLGMLGMHGTFAANKAVHHADLLLCLGVRFSDRVTGKVTGFSPKSKKIQVDIDAAEINKIVPVDMPVVGDIKEVLEKLNNMIKPCESSEWEKEATTWRKTVPRFEHSTSMLKPQEVIQMLDQYSEKSAIVATDVGQHQIFTVNNYKFENPRSLITSGGLGTMGFGLPAAIGAAVGGKGNQVLCVSGDGSFQMNYQELLTIIQYNLPIKIAILKNGYLGMVRQWQEMFYERRYSSVQISSPDFVTLASAYGLESYKAKNNDEANDIMKKAFAHSDPVVMEFEVFEEENVYPIVPPGKSNIELIINK